LQYPVPRFPRTSISRIVFLQILVENDRDIAELKAPGLVGPQSGIDGEEDIVVKLFRLPFEARFFGSCARVRVAS
jgi:hypothetical protein